MRKSILMVILGLTVFLIQGAVTTPNPNTSFTKRVKYFAQTTKAFATTFTDARDTVQTLYYMINGDPAVNNGEDGIIPFINQLLGPDALGGGLSSNGYTTCSSLPTSGSASLTEVDGGDTQVFTMTFASPSKSIPSGWTDGGTSFDRRVEVAVNVNGGGANDFMIAEFSCSSSSGYIKMDSQFFSNSEDRIVETYFQKNSGAGGRVEMLMICTDATCADTVEKLALDFYSPDGDEFTIFGSYAKDHSSDEAARAAIHGKKSVDLADVKYYQPNVLTNTNDLSSGTNVCVDFSAGDYDGTGQCAGQSLSIGDEFSSSALGLSDYEIGTINSASITAF